MTTPEAYIPFQPDPDPAVLPEPSPAAQELLDTIAKAAKPKDEVGKTRHNGLTTDIRNRGHVRKSGGVAERDETAVIKTRTEIDPDTNQRSFHSERLMFTSRELLDGNNGRVTIMSTGSRKGVKGGMQHPFDEYHISYDKKTGTANELSLRRDNFNDREPKIRHSGPMTERRMLALARLIRMQHGIKKEEVR